MCRETTIPALVLRRTGKFRKNLKAYDMLFSIKQEKGVCFFFSCVFFWFLNDLDIICNSGIVSEMDLNCYSSECHWFQSFNSKRGGTNKKKTPAKTRETKLSLSALPSPHPIYTHKQIDHGRTFSIWMVKEETFHSDNLTWFSSP